mgnify:CR=1 FL=1
MEHGRGGGAAAPEGGRIRGRGGLRGGRRCRRRRGVGRRPGRCAGAGFARRARARQGQRPARRAARPPHQLSDRRPGRRLHRGRERPRARSAILRACARHGAPVFFLGGGTNLLVSDRARARRGREARAAVRLRRVAARPARRRACGSGRRCRSSASVMHTVGGGPRRSRVRRGHSGTVGGGLLMNAGAFGGEIGRGRRCDRGRHRSRRARWCCRASASGSPTGASSCRRARSSPRCSCG